MAKYKLAWLETKGDDWKVASLESGEKDVSINRKSKKGELFPDFDNLKPGMEIEGELWQSPAGKWYLFPPKPQTTSGGAPRGSGGAFKTAQIEKAMDKKNEAIGKFQATKEESIRLSSAQRDAVLMVVTFYKYIVENNEAGLSERQVEVMLKERIVLWRDWFLLSKEFNDVPPFES